LYTSGNSPVLAAFLAAGWAGVAAAFAVVDFVGAVCADIRVQAARDNRNARRFIAIQLQGLVQRECIRAASPPVHSSQFIVHRLELSALSFQFSVHFPPTAPTLTRSTVNCEL
jgi:hypothetical protein